ncbi:hypothetical protein B7494_g8017 [Chlorociboria aeruginascens]|nr:hypothetical protein B7494_g8017 [Chlorociboria aeruginascens]
MARIFITGSSDGLGQLVARRLISQGHSVTLHARSSSRGVEALSAVPGASGILIGDLSSLSQTTQLAAEANKGGPFDTVIHNAAVGFRESRTITDDGIERLFAINALAPLMNVLLAFAVARHWPGVSSNAVSPGWVKTKMGGASAPGDLNKAVETVSWLACADVDEIGSGNYYSAQGSDDVHRAAGDEKIQEQFLKVCEEISGVSFPND